NLTQITPVNAILTQKWGLGQTRTGKKRKNPAELPVRVEQRGRNREEAECKSHSKGMVCHVKKKMGKGERIRKMRLFRGLFARQPSAVNTKWALEKEEC